MFEPLDFVMVRTPLLPVEAYARVLQGADLTVWAEDGVTREAIAVGSLSLLQTLPQLAADAPPRKREQAERGLWRYLNRMSTRSTPFGLFSGVACGELGERTELKLGAVSQHRKQTRPDMEWLLRVIQQVESRLETVAQLSVQVNSLVRISGSRVKLAYATQYGQQGSGAGRMEESSVRLTPVVELVLREARQLLPFAELRERVQAAYPDTPQEKISQFLWQLFQKEFLISELRPSLMAASPYGELLARLERVRGIGELVAKLRDIERGIAAYDALPIGTGERAYCELEAQMRELAEVKTTLQVDLALAGVTFVVSRALAQEAARAAEALWRMAPADAGYGNLESYRQAFLERYGHHREVPLLELLDEDEGLGAPATYEFPASRRKGTAQASDYGKRRDKLLLRWMMQAQQRGAREIELTDAMIAELQPVETPESGAPRSMELYVSLHARSQAALERGDYRMVLGANHGSNRAGQMFGRFVNLLGNRVRDGLREAVQREQDLRPDAVFAELVYLPVAGRASNVLLSFNAHDAEIVLGTRSSKEPERTITPDDLVVGMRGERLYLKSRRLGCEVVPVTTHMLNMQNTPNLYRFLRELAMEGTRNWMPFGWGTLETAPMLPRVRYGRVVLSAARWRLCSGVIAVEAATGSAAEWRRAVTAWRTEWQVPRKVYLGASDNRMLLDLEHDVCLEELRREFQKLQAGSGLVLTEAEGDLEETVAEGEQGRFLMECVFPLVRREAAGQAEREVAAVHREAAAASAILPAERVYLPGSEWLFLKLYGASAREEELIGWHLQEFCKQLAESGLVRKSFFMRYGDPDLHLRLRLHGVQERLTGDVLPEVHRFSRQLQAEGLLARLVIDTYDPEVERYGGGDLMKLAEEVFAADSQAVMHWIGLRRSGQLSLELELIGVVSLIDIMEQFGLSFAEQFVWLDAGFNRKDFLQPFRESRKRYLQAANSADDWAGLRRLPGGDVIHSQLQQRRPALIRYAQALREAEGQGELTAPIGQILGSVIHLHLNRLLGVDAHLERKVMALARHSLQNLRYLQELR
ncbi:thiopeptide-type bacteriocin biosynthesis protein [Tumebacillus sp. BK434]|uniref:lantibiotic dehydratase n=1 Tax=Tumebacillus sp. BK434 TaxID=2512169 RepID=UPI001051A462|nr:lantibiotic dehydratase [Tumebacillus sp. BK434]TCP58059.1 thiopeptide-type bacteriocin biosynthesis protein [Tumebacillus sp. BK434]